MIVINPPHPKNKWNTWFEGEGKGLNYYYYL